MTSQDVLSAHKMFLITGFGKSTGEEQARQLICPWILSMCSACTTQHHSWYTRKNYNHVLVQNIRKQRTEYQEIQVTIPQTNASTYYPRSQESRPRVKIPWWQWISRHFINGVDFLHIQRFSFCRLSTRQFLPLLPDIVHKPGYIQSLISGCYHLTKERHHYFSCLPISDCYDSRR